MTRRDIMTTRLVLKNETRWSTRDLRRVILAAMRECEIPGPLGLRVDVVYSRRPGVTSGRAWSNYVRLRMPRTAEAGVAGSLAVIEHELYHVRLFRTIGDHTHRDFPQRINDCVADGIPAWAAGIPLRLEAEKPKPAPVVSRAAAVAKREANARAHVARLDAEIARKRKLRVKWARRVAYYDRRAAAGRSGPK